MEESAVSEAVGVILIVAVTVILAAIIAAYAFGLVGNIQSNYNVVVTIDKIDSTHYSLMYRGGSDHQKLTQLRITWPDNTQLIDNTPVVGKVYGPILVLDTPGHQSHLVVVGHFSDLREQVLLNTFV